MANFVPNRHIFLMDNQFLTFIVFISFSEKVSFPSLQLSSKGLHHSTLIRNFWGQLFVMSLHLAQYEACILSSYSKGSSVLLHCDVISYLHLTLVGKAVCFQFETFAENSL